MEGNWNGFDNNYRGEIMAWIIRSTVFRDDTASEASGLLWRADQFMFVVTGYSRIIF